MRPTPSICFVTAAAILLFAAPVVAADQETTSRAAGKSRAYRSLFPVPDLKSVPSTASPRTAEVVCGMPIIPADPRIDPKMAMQPPSDKRHTLRIIPPPVCR